MGKHSSAAGSLVTGEGGIVPAPLVLTEFCVYQMPPKVSRSKVLSSVWETGKKEKGQCNNKYPFVEIWRWEVRTSQGIRE